MLVGPWGPNLSEDNVDHVRTAKMVRIAMGQFRFVTAVSCLLGNCWIG